MARTLSFLALLGVLGVVAACPGPRAPRPDVVLVVVDTLRADRTTVLDPSLPTTESLAALGRRGVVYAQAVSPSSWTLPAMAGLFSGREVATSRTRAFEDAPALAERFADAGYHTVGLVANPLLTTDNGFDRGFDRYEVAPARDLQVLREDLGALRAWNAEALVEQALAAVASTPSDRPLFLYLHLMDPHAPYDPAHARFAPPSPGWSAPTADGRPPPVVWTDALDGPQQRLLEAWRRGYDGEILFTDRMLGRLLDVLQAGPRGAPVVAVTSDHGEGLFSHLRNPDREHDDGPLGMAYDEHGEQLYEEAVRVPLWLAGPGVPVGRREARAVSTASLGATLLSLAGLPAAGARLPLDDDDPVPPVVLGSGSRGWFARTAAHKLVEPFPYRAGRPGVAPRLFAVEAEAYAPEAADLTAERPEQAADLRALLRRWREAEGGAEPGAEAVDPATLERLRRLGYVR